MGRMSLPDGQSIFLASYRRPTTMRIRSAGDPTVDATQNPATNSLTPADRAVLAASASGPSWGTAALGVAALGLIGAGFYRSAVSGLGALALVSAGASAYHGVKRHDGSWVWGAWWGTAGAMFPVITPVIAVAQGYAKPLPA